VPYRVDFLPSAARELRSLPKSRQRNLARRIDTLEADHLPVGAKKLEGEAKLYRLRSSDYRIIFQIDDDSKTITIVKIGHRRDVYRRL
jgi:mRNA interferase RelE/StbE